MKTATLPIPEIGLMAATRSMAGAGAAMLFASRLDDKKRKMIGWPLFIVGAAATIPLVIDIVRRVKAEEESEEEINGI